MHSKTTNLLLIAALIGTIALVVAPAASAQTTPTLSIEGLKSPDGAIKPEIGQDQLSFNIAYPPPNAAVPAVGAVASTAVVTVTPTCTNPNVFVQGTQTVLIPVNPSQNAGGTKYTGPASFSVTVNRLAPGLQLLQCTMRSEERR